jgi:hypothetical protein
MPEGQQSPSGNFDIKPLEMHDFSGGLTDNFFDGGPTHYYQGDNWWITIDKKFQERYGTIVLDPNAYQLPNAQSTRIGYMFTFINESILLAQSGRNICYYSQNQGFYNILGPNGVNEALGGGGFYSNLTACEWQHQMYFASDAQCNPIKIYRDQTNTWQVRTAGLPRAGIANSTNAVGTLSLTNDQILAQCLTLVNNIRTSMIAHWSDVNLHAIVDKVSLNYFVAQTFNPGDELPPSGVTPLGAAVDLPSLLLLIGNMNAAYENHRADASLNGERVVHNNYLDGQPNNPYQNGSFIGYQYNYINPTGLHVKLSNQSTPTMQTAPLGSTVDATRLTLIIVAAQANDLAQKWYWHRMATFTHHINNDYNTINQYTVTAPLVGTINQGAPVVTGNLTDLYSFVNNCKYYYNTHVLDGGVGYSSHTFATGTIFNPSLYCGLPDCTDFNSMANLVFWLRNLYYIHYSDAANNYYRLVNITTNANSPAQIQEIVYTNSPQTPTLGFTDGNTAGVYGWAVNWILYCPENGSINDYNGGIVPADVAVSTSQGGSPLITLLNVNGLPQSLSAASGTQLTYSKYHVALDLNGNIIDAVPPNYQGTFQPNVNSAFASSPTATGADASTWLTLAEELYFILSAHASDNTVHLNAKAFNNTSGSLPTPQGGGYNTNVTNQNASAFLAPYQPFFVPTIASYLYAFVFTDTYQVEPNGLIYTVQSNPVIVGPVETSTIIPPGATVLSEAINTYPNITYTTLQGIQITNLPQIVNNANTNYFTSNITIDIYRTTDGGTTFYRLLPSSQSLANGTLSYLDQTSDSVSYTNTPALNTNPPIYTTGGVVGNDQPPPATCIATLGGFTYYANIVDTGQAFPYRIRQSLQNNPDSAPATFYDDLDDAIVGIAATRSIIVAFCGRSVYRVTGNFNSLGQGSMVHEKISDKMGCISAKSIVSTEIGIFFAGLDGFYYTDGYQLIKITIDLNARYQAFTTSTQQQSRISGAYDRYNRRIHWTMQTQTTDTNQDCIWTYYLDYGVKPQGVFTTASNFTYFRPASVVAYQGTIVYGHELGYFLKFDPYTKTDPIITTGSNPTTWNTAYIPYNFASCSLSLGTLFKRKYSTKVHWVGENVGNVSGQITSIRDNRQDLATALAPVQFNYNPMWGQPNIKWQPGDSVNPYPWEYDHKLDAWRRFPAGQLRGDLKQLTITPAFTGIYRYEDWPTYAYATISGSGTTKTVTIATPTGYTSIIWPPDCVNYVIAFAPVGTTATSTVTAQYTITAVSGNALTISDPNNALTAASNLVWVIRGYKKQQRARIDSLIVHFDFLGDKNDQYLGPQSSGENI